MSSRTAIHSGEFDLEMRYRPKEGTVNTQVADSHPLTRPEAKPKSEVEHIKPELRARFVPLESQGLLAAGI